MIVDNSIWKYEPEKQTIIFISQTGHGKPMVAAYNHVNSQGGEKLKEAVKEDNTLFRVFTPHREHTSFVIYKKHYNTRDKAEDILKAFEAVRQAFPNKTLKLSMEQPLVYETLKDEPNVEFYTRSAGFATWLLTKYMLYYIYKWKRNIFWKGEKNYE